MVGRDLGQMGDGLGDQSRLVALRFKEGTQIGGLDIGVAHPVDPVTQIVVPKLILKQTHDPRLRPLFDLADRIHA